MAHQFRTPHPSTLDEDALLAECRFTFTRRGGPGGQHRNKVESAVVVTHVPTQIIAEANERRDQSQNRRIAVNRLRRQLAWLVRSRWIETNTNSNTGAAANGETGVAAISALWRKRCIEQPANVSVEHWDFATLLSEALDHLVACRWEISTAAQNLGVSTARLGKLLKADRQTLEWINRQRKDAGFPTLR